MQNKNPSAAVFSVTQLNQRAKQLLEISLSNVRVEGELSSLSRPSSGHWYFSLKDKQSQVRCAMFRSRTSRLSFLPKEGDKVEIRAKVSLYEARGDYQLIVDSMKPAGEGALLLAFQQLKEKLRLEGLFDAERKKPLPKIKRVGVITSSTGAALHDILTVLVRRNPQIEVDIYPTLVQGKEATQGIVAALERANRDARVDALIVGRGGGSLEDLWCFNEEAVAKAISQSVLPVVSAVGHEVDVTIADFVADMRAPTPSAAAELISDDRSLQLQTLQNQENRLSQALTRSLKQQQVRLLQLQQRLRNPVDQLQRSAQQLDQLEQRMMRAWQNQLNQKQWRLKQHTQALNHQHPKRQLSLTSDLLRALEKRLGSAVQANIRQQQQKLAAQTHLLNNLSPLQVLSRGYSICQQADGTLVERYDQVSEGERIQTKLKEGWLDCKVIKSHGVDLFTPEEPIK